MFTGRWRDPVTHHRCEVKSAGSPLSNKSSRRAPRLICNLPQPAEQGSTWKDEIAETGHLRCSRNTGRPVESTVAHAVRSRIGPVNPRSKPSETGQFGSLISSRHRRSGRDEVPEFPGSARMLKSPPISHFSEFSRRARNSCDPWVVILEKAAEALSTSNRWFRCLAELVGAGEQ